MAEAGVVNGVVDVTGTEEEEEAVCMSEDEGGEVVETGGADVLLSGAEDGGAEVETMDEDAGADEAGTERKVSETNEGETDGESGGPEDGARTEEKEEEKEKEEERENEEEAPEDAAGLVAEAESDMVHREGRKASGRETERGSGKRRKRRSRG